MIRRVVATTLLTCGIALGQTSNPTHHKPLAFEVVSIRPGKPGDTMGGLTITPNGFHSRNMTIYITLMEAYFPQGMSYWSGSPSGTVPKWFFSNSYDIEARISDADRAAWQKQSMTIDAIHLSLEKQPMLREMLQTMLADRLKLAIHRAPGQIEGYALVPDKRGPRLTPSRTGAPLPKGFPLPDGGIVVLSDRGHPTQWMFYSASMADAVSELKVYGLPIVDRTGLTGRYDFVMRCGAFDAEHPDWGCQGNPSDALMQWDLRSLGLRLEHAKVPVDTIVIDHIEQPSAN